MKINITKSYWDVTPPADWFILQDIHSKTDNSLSVEKDDSETESGIKSNEARVFFPFQFLTSRG
jgi:hypothetical protein